MASCDTGQTLLPIAEAISRLKAAAKPIIDTEVIPTEQALGRVLAEEIVSPIHVPPADNTAMDGYAVYSDDISTVPVSLPVSQRIAAGAVGKPLDKGSAARIFTGAPIPAGANVVVMQESCDEDKGLVTIKQSVDAGANIRYQGEDIAKQAVILNKGHKCLPQDLGLMASVGCAQVVVYRRMKVAIMTTGDELCVPGEPLKSGQIYNSNRYTLIGLLQQIGCDCVDLGIIEDNLSATKQALLQAAEKADLIITSGGVSVGEEDHVRAAIESLGRIDMWRMNMKPGKPLAFGFVGHTPLLGLPGNPVSVFATFYLFAKHYIQQCQGRVERVNSAVTSYQVAAGFDWPKPDSRDEYLRVRYDSHNQQLQVYTNQSSGVLTSTVWATGFLYLPAGQTIKQGDLVEYMPFSELI